MDYCIRFGMTVSEFWQCRPIDSHLFLKARIAARNDEVEQGWDYTRHEMWAAIKPHVEKDLKPHQLIRLKRDGKEIDLTPYDAQELKKWNEEMDKQMLNG